MMSQKWRPRTWGECRHCRERKRLYSRGLCHGCFFSPAVRMLHPPASKFGYRGVGARTPPGAPLPAEPTTALPRSEEKIVVMEGRAERGEQLFHPLDARAG